MRAIKWVIAIVFVIGAAATAFGHSGGTDRNGCHTDKKTGQRHCH